MSKQKYFIHKKAILGMALCLFLGFGAKAQQTPGATAPKPPATVIYASHLSQMSSHKQEYIKAHPEEFIIKADPIHTSSAHSTTETFLSPNGSVLKGKDYAALKRAQHETEVAARPVSVSQKNVITKAQFDAMPQEKQQFIREHSSMFEITD